MIILLKQNPDPRKLSSLRTWLRSMDFEIHYSQGTSTTLMGLVGDTSSLDIDMIRALDVVEEAMGGSGWPPAAPSEPPLEATATNLSTSGGWG